MKNLHGFLKFYELLKKRHTPKEFLTFKDSQPPVLFIE